MIQNGHTSGYKASPLGVIPKEWEVKRLGEFSTFFSGGTPKSDNALYYNGNIPFIRSGEIGRDKTELFLSQEGFDSSSAKIVEKGDLLYALYGANSGQCSLSKINGAINQAILCIRPKANRYYVMSVLQFNKEHYYNSYLQGGQGNLSSEIVSNYKLAVPPIEEQKKIAELLSKWDRVIELQTKLIEKLELRKRSLMQRLLTGRVRLNGFSAKWKKTSINSFAEEISIKNKNNEPLIVLSCTKYNGLVPSLEYFGKQVYPDDVTKYKIVQKNHFAYATNHIEEGSIGYQTIENRALISPMYTVFCTNSQIINNIYLYALLKTPHLIYLYKSRMEGSIDRRGGLRWESFSSIKIDLPPLAEQAAIAEMLASADKEIEFEKQKLSKFRNQKQGLMQQLLTGKRRVKL